MDTNQPYQPQSAGSTSNSKRSPINQLRFHAGRVGRAFTYSSGLLASIAMIEVAIAMSLLSLAPSPAPIVVGLITFAVYANDRVADADEDIVSNPGQAAFARRHRDSLYLLAALAYASAIAISLFAGPLALALTLLPGAFWVLYGSHWLSSVNGHVDRLKSVLVVNSAVVALAWATCLTLLPVVFADTAISPAVAVVFAYFFLRSFVDVEIPNVRDIEADRNGGVKTLPTTFGVGRTRRALYSVDLFTAGVVVYAAAIDLIAWSFVAALVVGLCYSLVLISRLGRTAHADVLGQAPNGEYVLVGAVMVAIAFIG